MNSRPCQEEVASSSQRPTGLAVRCIGIALRACGVRPKLSQGAERPNSRSHQPTHVLRTPADHLRSSLARAADAQKPQDRCVDLGSSGAGNQRTAQAKDPCSGSAGKTRGSISASRSRQSVRASAEHGLRFHCRGTTPEAPVAQGPGQLVVVSLPTRRYPSAWIASRRFHSGRAPRLPGNGTRRRGLGGTRLDRAATHRPGSPVQAAASWRRRVGVTSDTQRFLHGPSPRKFATT